MSRTSTSTFRARTRLALEELECRCLLSGYTPTVAEQLFLQELNAARANPAAYGASIGLDLSYVAPAPPLAFNTDMIAAARLHSQDMNNNAYFSHISPSGSDPGQRLTAAGVAWTTWGESIAAGGGYAQPSQALAGLIVDAGVADLGHRNQLLDIGSTYAPQNQVGIGIVQNGGGPYQNYYTIDTAATTQPGPFLTGVVYNDANHNSQYDAGEGLGGVTISVNGVPTVSTWDTGGYTVALSPGTYSITASGGGLNGTITQTVTVGSANVELDFTAGQASSGGAASGASQFFVTIAAGLYEYNAQQGWKVIGNPGTIQSVSTATEASGHTVAFAVTNAGGLYRYSDSSGWSQLGAAGTIRSVSAGTNASGQADAFVLTTGGVLSEYDPSSGWMTLGGAGSVLSMSAASGGRVYVVGSDHSALVHDNQYGWLRLSGSGFAQSLSAVTDAAGNQFLFVVTQDHALYRYNQQWGWTQLGSSGTVQSALAGLDFSGEADVAVVTMSNGMAQYEAQWGWMVLAGSGQIQKVAAAEPGQFIAITTDNTIMQHDDHWGWSALTGHGFAHS
jgi:uncharacterized protein YkwD